MKESILNRCRLFVDLREDDLARLTMRAKEAKVKNKEIILREGDGCPKNPLLYIIDKGDIKLVKKDSQGIPQKIGIMEKGNIFGVENLTGRFRGLTAYPLSYEASSDVTLYTLSNEDLKQALSEEGYVIVALNIAIYLSRWMRACLERCATIEILSGYIKVISP